MSKLGIFRVSESAQYKIGEKTMAFVNEKIVGADREILNSFNLKSPFTNKPLESREWTIDRERDVFLVGLGGQGTYNSEIPMYYALVWKKGTIIMETFSEGIGSFTTGTEMHQKITKIEAPESLLTDKDEMLQIIKEAFDGKGVAGRRDCVTNVIFDFIAESKFIRGMN